MKFNTKRKKKEKTKLPVSQDPLSSFPMGLSGLLLKSSEIKRREKDIRAGEPSYMAQGTDISTWNTKNYQ
jgi:hypothetical protein